jgi:transposase
VEVSVVEQRYRAVLEVKAGVPVTEAAARAGVSRQSVHAWVRRYEQGGLGALADRPKRPDTCPHQTSAQVEAAVCEMRREHPKWGPLRLAHELGKTGVVPAPSRMSVYRVQQGTTGACYRMGDGGRVPKGVAESPFAHQGAPCADGRHHRH